MFPIYSLKWNRKVSIGKEMESFYRGKRKDLFFNQNKINSLVWVVWQITKRMPNSSFSPKKYIPKIVIYRFLFLGIIYLFSSQITSYICIFISLTYDNTAFFNIPQSNISITQKSIFLFRPTFIFSRNSSSLDIYIHSK